MELKSRQVQLLRSLSQSVGKGLPLADVMSEFGVSRRTVYYDISRINDWLTSAGLGSVSVEDQCLRARGVQWSSVERLSGSADQRYFSVAERQSMAFLRIALSSEPVTIGVLMDSFGVSRNTVIADVHEIRESLDSLGLSLSSVAAAGYEVLGDEITIRKRIWSSLKELADSGHAHDAKRFLQAALVRVTNNDIDYYALCRSLIKQYESDLKTRCFLESNGLEGMMVQVSWLRGLAGNSVVMGRDEQITLMGTVSYRSVQCSAEKLKSVGIALPSEEILYITSLLLGIKTADFAHQSEEDAYVSSLAESLIGNFERVACLTFVNKEFVKEQLSHHIRPLFYRQKYGIPVHNPLTDDVRKMYPMSFEFCRRAAIESGMGSLSDDELAFLTIYLSSDLDSKMLERGDTSADRVLIVGADNMSAATLVRDQLSQACGISFDCEYADSEKLHRWTLESYAVVLALVPLPPEMRSDNMVEVTPFFSEENKHQIYGVLKRNRIISRYDSLIGGILDIMSENMPEGDSSWLGSDHLYFELFKFFDDGGRCTVNSHAPMVGDAHIREDTVILESGGTWQQAVLRCAEALQGDSAGSSLVERMKNLVRGPRFMYYRMACDVVVVRCPVQGDKGARVAAQIALCDDGVVFPDGAPAKIVICISTINRYSHWGTLFSIYELFSDRGVVDRFEDECRRRSGRAGGKGRTCLRSAS